MSYRSILLRRSSFSNQARLLPVAAAGLTDAGVEKDEASDLLGVIEKRVASGTTGARWQRQTLARLELTMGREPALAAMLELYLEHSASGRPVHLWPLE